MNWKKNFLRVQLSSNSVWVLGHSMLVSHSAMYSQIYKNRCFRKEQQTLAPLYLAWCLSCLKVNKGQSRHFGRMCIMSHRTFAKQPPRTQVYMIITRTLAHSLASLRYDTFEAQGNLLKQYSGQLFSNFISFFSQQNPGRLRIERLLKDSLGVLINRTTQPKYSYYSQPF